jgi:putative hydrolase of the HAD superfamily
MIKAIVFDLDGMVCLTKEMFSDRYAREHDIDVNVMVSFFKNQLGECQLGRLDLKQELEKVLGEWQWAGSVDELLDYWFADSEVNEAMMGLVRTLQAKGVKCGLCTNNEKYRIEYLKNKFGLAEKFDFFVSSYEVELKKPDPGIYQLVAKETGLKPDEIMICDDKEKNVDLISELGFVPYVYENIESFKEKLENLQIL